MEHSVGRGVLGWKRGEHRPPLFGPRNGPPSATNIVVVVVVVLVVTRFSIP